MWNFSMYVYICHGERTHGPTYRNVYVLLNMRYNMRNIEMLASLTKYALHSSSMCIIMVYVYALLCSPHPIYLCDSATPCETVGIAVCFFCRSLK